MSVENQKWYRTGQVSVTNGGTVVTGINTDWLVAGIKPGDALVLENKPYEIASVEGSASLRLVKPYPGETVAGKEYSIIQFAKAVLQSDIAADLRETLDAWNKQSKFFSDLGLYVDDDGDLAQDEDGPLAQGTMTSTALLEATASNEAVKDMLNGVFH